MSRVSEPYVKLADTVHGFVPARILHAAVRLDLFSKLANEGKSAAQLAVLLEVDPAALELLLNALSAMGFLRKEQERFHDTPISHTYLSRTGPKFLGHYIAHVAGRWDDWGQLEQALRTGKPVRSVNMYQDDPAALNDFIRGMHELAIARGDARYLARAIPLRRCRKMLDLAGGPGTYASMFCRANRNLTAVVMDLPATLKVTRRILREFDLSGRVKTMSGDYRKDRIKGGPYDVVLVSNVLHAERESVNRKLLRSVYEALVPGGILILKDHVLTADHTAPPNAALFALEMFLGTGARTYAFAEIAGWAAEAGFQDMVEVPLPDPMNVSLVLALRPGKRALAVLPRPAAVVARTGAGTGVEVAPETTDATATAGAAAASGAASRQTARETPRSTKPSTTKAKTTTASGNAKTAKAAKKTPAKKSSAKKATASRGTAKKSAGSPAKTSKKTTGRRSR